MKVGFWFLRGFAPSRIRTDLASARSSMRLARVTLSGATWNAFASSPLPLLCSGSRVSVQRSFTTSIMPFPYPGGATKKT